MRTANIIRLIGTIAIAVFLPFESAQSPGSFTAWCRANALVLVGVLPTVTFLWLAATGSFGYGSPRRQDWPALLPFAIALGVREGYARHGIAELELHVFTGAFPDRHSLVHPFLQMFLQQFASDPYPFIFHVNGVLGALATLPLYLFVRQRTHSLQTGIMVALFFALHPILVQMAPTDGPYSLLESTWFFALALLSGDSLRGSQLLGSAGLLALAATCRAEGAVFLVASLLLIDVHFLLESVRRHPKAAAGSFCLVTVLVGLQAYYTFSAHVLPGDSLPSLGSPSLPQMLRAGIWSVDFNDKLFVALVGVGGLTGALNPRLRIGLGAVLGAVLVGWPVSAMQVQSFVVLHRFVPVCSLQTIAAGVGAAWVTSWLTARARENRVVIVPALLAALYLFARNRHQVHDANAVTEEFWMLRKHLAVNGTVKKECTLLVVGRPMDTDICNFGQVLPGMTIVHCEKEDCVRLAAEDRCFYYLRSLNCFYAEAEVATHCEERTQSATGRILPCTDPRCMELERKLRLSAVDVRTVAFKDVFFGSPNSWPERADIGLYHVTGVNR